MTSGGARAGLSRFPEIIAPVKNAHFYIWKAVNETIVDLPDAASQTLVAPNLEDGVLSEEVAITLTVVDAKGFQAKDEVLVTIMQNNKAPIANNDSVTMEVGEVINFNPLDNDNDIDGRLMPESLLLTKLPEFGNVVVNDDGSVIYTHTGATAGEDSFSYQVTDNDGAVSNTVIVNIVVKDPVPEEVTVKMLIELLNQGLNSGELKPRGRFLFQRYFNLAQVKSALWFALLTEHHKTNTLLCAKLDKVARLSDGLDNPKDSLEGPGLSAFNVAVQTSQTFYSCK